MSFLITSVRGFKPSIELGEDNYIDKKNINYDACHKGCFTTDFLTQPTIISGELDKFIKSQRKYQEMLIIKFMIKHNLTLNEFCENYYLDSEFCDKTISESSTSIEFRFKPRYKIRRR